MPAATRKRAAAKPAAAKPLVFEADFKKETAGAVQFAEVGDRDGHVSGGIYIRKGSLDGVTPQKIRVTIEIV